MDLKRTGWFPPNVAAQESAWLIAHIVEVMAGNIPPDKAAWERALELAHRILEASRALYKDCYGVPPWEK